LDKCAFSNPAVKEESESPSISLGYIARSRARKQTALQAHKHYPNAESDQSQKQASEKKHGWLARRYAHVITCIYGTNSCTCMGDICTCHELLQCRLPANGQISLGSALFPEVHCSL
jgi:hypothetical protein